MSLISLVITTYNQERDARRLADALLREDLRGYEVIWADDCSSDGTVEVLRGTITDLIRTAGADEAVVLKSDVNRRAGGNRNHAAEWARGEYLWFFDCDDEFVPGSLAKVADAVRSSHPDCLFFGFETRGRRGGVRETFARELNSWNLPVAPWMKVFRREKFVPFGRWRYQEDKEWWPRQRDEFDDVRFLDEKVVVYHRDNGGITDRVADFFADGRTWGEMLADPAANHAVGIEWLEQMASISRLQTAPKHPELKRGISLMMTHQWMSFTPAW